MILRRLSKFVLLLLITAVPMAADEDGMEKTSYEETISQIGDPSPPELDGASWSLDSYLSREGEPLSLLPNTEITASFESGIISGDGGCNRYRGGYVSEGDSIKFSGFASTLMICADDVSAQESDYLMNLQNATRYNISGNLLRMTDANGTVLLTYSVLKPQTIVGTNWRMLSYNNGLGLISALAGSEVTASFSEDGSLTGTAGCNNYRASYQINDSNINISPIAVTYKFCSEPEGIMEQEKDYLAALEPAKSFRIERQRLYLLFENGSTVATFESAAVL